MQQDRTQVVKLLWRTLVATLLVAIGSPCPHRITPSNRNPKGTVVDPDLAVGVIQRYTGLAEQVPNF